MFEQQQAIDQRRLKPIYDAIDAGQNKKAIQEADKVLKKHSITPCAKALKALALVRSEKASEAVALIGDLEGETEICDENTLQALTHCFKELGTPERIASFYERAVANNPHSELLLTHLFMAHVRLRNYKQQQKIAQALFKEYPKNPYYFWHVMSVVMQAVTDTKLGKSLLFPLAEKMVQKMVDSDSIQEVELYLLILEAQEKWTEAIDVLENRFFVRHLQTPVQFMFYRILRLHQRAGHNDLVFNRSLDALDNDREDWTLWQCLFTSAIALLDSTTDSLARVEIVDRLTDRIVSLFNREDGDSMRSISLARLSLISQVLVQHEVIPRAQLGDPLLHLRKYVEVFAGRSCCFADIRPYLWLLSDEQVGVFLDGCFVSTTTSDCSVSESDEWRRVFYLRVQRALRHRNPSCHGEETKPMDPGTISQWVSSIQNTSFPQIAAALAHLAAFELWDRFSSIGDDEALFLMILLLEWASPMVAGDFGCKLILTRAYNTLGVIEQCRNLASSLDVKYVQRDSLSYLLFGLQERYGMFKPAIVHYGELGTMFDQAERELNECLITAYKNGAFNRVPNLVDFSNKCRNSSAAIGADILCRFLTATACIETHSLKGADLDAFLQTLGGDQEPIDFSKVVDNRDFSIIPCFESDAYSDRIKAFQADSNKELLDALKLRHQLCLCTAAIGRGKVDSLDLARLIGELKAHCVHCRSSYLAVDKVGNGHTLLQVTPIAVDVTSDRLWNGAVPLLERLFDGALAIVRSSESIGVMNGMSLVDDKGHGMMSEGMPLVDDIMQSLQVLIGDQRLPNKEEKSNGGLSMRELISDASLAIETISLSLLILSMVEKRVGILDENKNRTKRKGARKSDLEIRLSELRVQLCNGAHRLEQQLETLFSYSEKHKLYPSHSTFDWNQETVLINRRAEVEKQISNSFKKSLDSMCRFLSALQLSVSK